MKNMYLRICATILILGASLICFSAFTKKEHTSEVSGYMEIEGITDEEIKAIEGLKDRYTSLVYGCLESSEAYYNGESKTIDGFSSAVCDEFSRLFGIEFEIKIFEREQLYDGLRDGSIHFTSEYTRNIEGIGTTYRTDKISERHLNIITHDSQQSVPDAESEGRVIYGFFESYSYSYEALKSLGTDFEAKFYGAKSDIATALRAGEIDAFIAQNSIAMSLAKYDDITVETFLPVIYTDTTVSAVDEEFLPIIEVMNKYLDMFSYDKFHDTYNEEWNKYQQFLFKKSLSEEELLYLNTYIDKNERIPVIFEYSNYPLSFYNENENEWQGIAIDILSEAEQIAGVEFYAVNEGVKDFSTAFGMLKSGKGKLLSELMYSEERAEDFIWSNPYHRSKDVFISLNETKHIEFSEVMHKRVGVIKGAAYYDKFNNLFRKDLQPTADYPELMLYKTPMDAFRGLEEGEIDLFFSSDNKFLYAPNYLEKSDFKINLSFDNVVESSFGFSKDDEVLCSIINKAQNLIDIDLITNNWTLSSFDYQKKLQEKTIPILLITLMLSLVVLLLIYFLYHKNKKVNKILEYTVGERTELLEKSEKAVEDLIKETPIPCIILDDNYVICNCNDEALRLVHVQSEEELICHFTDNLKEASRGETQDSFMKNIKRMAGGKSISFQYQDTLLDGCELSCIANAKWIKLKKNTRYIVCYINNVTGIKKSEEELRLANELLSRQINLLQVVNTIANNIISSNIDNFDDVIYSQMELMGNLFEVQHICVWENYEDGGKSYAKEVCKWSVDGDKLTEENRKKIDYEKYPQWKNSMMNNNFANGPISSIEQGEQIALDQKDVVSVLAVHVPLSEGVWGFIRIVDCYNERSFTKAEQNALQSCGILIASAILRNNYAENLLEVGRELMAHDELLRAVNSVARVILQGDNDYNTTVSLALAIMTKSINAKCADLWRDYVDEKGKACARQVCKCPELNLNDKMVGEISICYDEVLPKWANSDYIREDLFNSNEEIQGSDSLFDNNQTFESLLIPIVFQGRNWGFIRYKYNAEASLDENQRSILRSAGMMIASAIVRDEINESLVEAREAAIASMNSKSDFLARMSHEIRTPMNAIIGMTEVAQRTNEADKIMHCLDKISIASSSLLGIINDILDMSKIEANKFEISEIEFDFEKMIQKVSNIIQVKVDEKQQTFTYDFDYVFERCMISDELRISQVLTNLLNNAVKFTPEKGNITLRIRHNPIDENNSTIRIEVQDNGIGIKQDQINKLFTSFEQADGSITREYGGSGLGLAICKNIINLMGGTIWIESEYGKGSTFIFEIDVAWSEKRSSTSLINQTDNRDLRILVIDDSEDTLFYFKNILESSYIKCDIATSGKQAVEMVEKSLSVNAPYDLVFVDWIMPEMSGSEAARIIKDKMDNNVIVIMISSAGIDEVREEVKRVGIDKFLAKPVLPSQLLDTVFQFTDKHTKDELENKGNLDLADGKIRDWHDKTILLVEDNMVNQEIVLLILEDTKVNIECAENGKIAVDKFAANPDKYDVILMDIQMPVLDGLSASKKIRALDIQQADSIPIIAMTANAFNEDKIASVNAGMNGHITKPLDLDELYEILDKLFDDTEVTSN